MDKKQNQIFHNILSKFGLRHDNIKFVQHRNLNEFRYFMIERINPNHVIQLYGKLKRPYIKDGHPNKIIKVGEILLSYGFLFLSTKSFILNIQIYFIATLTLFYMIYDFIRTRNIEGFINAYWSNWKYRKWKNHISC